MDGITYMPVSKTTREVLCCALSVVGSSFPFSVSDQCPVGSSLSPVLPIVFVWPNDDQEVAYLFCFPRCYGLLFIKCVLAVEYAAACFVFWGFFFPPLVYYIWRKNAFWILIFTHPVTFSHTTKTQERIPAPLYFLYSLTKSTVWKQWLEIF